MTTLLVGLGHLDRGDDAAGVLVAQRLVGVPDLVVRATGRDPSDVLADPLWDEADRVVLVDAVRTGAPAGTLHRWGAGELFERLDAPTPVTHELGVATTLALARALGRLPHDLTVLGIEGGSFGHGQPLSPAVAATVDDLVAAWA